MSIAQAIAPHLPYLRRFARALSGTQQGGDSYALATLEALVADPSSFDEAVEPRVALYRAFLKVWSSIPLNQVAEAAARGQRQCRRAPKPRSP